MRPGRLWSRENVVHKIWELHQKGERLNAGYVQTHLAHCRLYLAARRHWGSWQKAISAAGFDYAKIRIHERLQPRWSRRIVIETIQQMHQRGEQLNSRHIQGEHRTFFRAAGKLFGGWGQAVQAAGIDYCAVRVRVPGRRWSKPAIVRAIQARHHQGLPINGLAVFREDIGLYDAARHHFGKDGWRKALKRAGFDARALNPCFAWTRERVIKDIHRRRAGGEPLYESYLQRTGAGMLVGAGKRRFGTWKKAIEAAGLNYDEIRACRYRWWSKRRILNEIGELARAGASLGWKTTRSSRYDLLGAATAYFGSWGRAVEAAGINYRQHLGRWSRKTWLRTLTPAKLKAMERQVGRLAAMRRSHCAKVELRPRSGIAGERHRDRRQQRSSVL